MNIVTTIWYFIVKHVDSFRFTITEVTWFFKIVDQGWRFKIEQEGDFHFVIKPSGFWILRDGYWDNSGIWVNTEVWKIP